MTEMETPLDLQDVQAAGASLLLKDIEKRLSQIGSFHNILFGKDYDGSGTAGQRITLPDLLKSVC